MSRRIELWPLALLGAAVTVAAIAGVRRGVASPDLDSRTSAFLSGPRGSKALHDVLGRLGFAVERRRAPFFQLARDTAPRPAVLVVLNPVIPLLPAERAQVVGFVEAGGAAVAVGAGGGLTGCAGWHLRYSPSPFLEDTIPVLERRGQLSLPPSSNVLERRPPSAADEGEDACRRLVPAAVDTLLEATNRRPVVLRLRYPGGGSVTLAADPGYFRNRAWRSGNVPYFVAPLLAPRRPGPIVWDEYHQGFGEDVSLSGATFEWLLGNPVGWAVLQLALVALVALVVQGVRFGPARPVLERRRRSPLEHLDALAAGLAGAAGVDTAVQLTVSGLRRRLSRTGRVPAGGERQWLAALEHSLPTAQGRAAVRRLERCLTEPGGADRVLAAAQSVEDVWEELRPRTMRDAS